MILGRAEGSKTEMDKRGGKDKRRKRSGGSGKKLEAEG